MLVNVWEGVDARREARKFRDLWGIEGTILLDEEGAFVDRLGIRGVPTNILVDADGTVAEVGVTAPEELFAAVGRLLGAAPGLGEAARGGGWHWGTAAPEHIERHVTSLSRERRDGPATPGVGVGDRATEQEGVP